MSDPTAIGNSARAQLWYRLRNLPARIRGLAPRLMLGGALSVAAALSAVHIRADGTRVDLGVISTRLVTTAGVTQIANAFINTFEPENFNFHDSGTGVVAEAIGDTTLGTPTGNARVAGTQSSPSAGVYQTSATLSYAGAFAITEHGIFSALTVGTLLDRSKFAAINVVAGDSITFTYVLTFTAGG